MKRVIAALNMPRRIHDYISQAEFIGSRLASDPLYAGSSPPLAVFEAHLAALQKAALNVHTRALGSVEARNAAFAAVDADLQALRLFVEHLAAASPDGPMIIANAGMSVKNATGPVKSGFVVKLGTVSGKARMIARAERIKASYDWQYSRDGEAWISLESTVESQQDVEGLVPGAVYFFRYRTLTRAGTSDWSQVVSVMAA
jgi:hypothetical protein